MAAADEAVLMEEMEALAEVAMVVECVVAALEELQAAAA